MADVDPVDAYAQCLVDLNSGRVARVLDHGFGEDYETAASRIGMRNCLPNTLESASPAELRGPLFAAMYRKFGPQAGRSAATIAVDPSFAPPPTHPLAGWYAVSSCIVTRAPGDARALVRAAPASAEVRERFSALVPHIRACLPADQQFAIKRDVLVGLLAETVYRQDVAPVPGSAPF